MKNLLKNTLLIFVLFAVFGFSAASVYAQKELNPKIIAAIKSANAKELSTYFNNPVDLTTPGNEGTYSKAQAEMIVKSFFQK
ncbi:MAG: DUF4783 domain-containing protein, partial [Lentimicrobium sp.]|nr:DUF4783 domain-containing protein [Lentimicrobium sp.]